MTQELIERFVAGLEKADRAAKGIQNPSFATRNAPKAQRRAIYVLGQYRITGFLAAEYMPFTREEMQTWYAADLALFVAGRHREPAGIKLNAKALAALEG